MRPKIAIIQGDPDSTGFNFRHGLAAAYCRGARESEYDIRVVDVARMRFPLARTQDELAAQAAPEAIREAQEVIGAAAHLMIVYPLWHGEMPALLHGFLEQAFRPGFHSGSPEPGRAAGVGRPLRTARIVVTAGMPLFSSRWLRRGRSQASLRDNVLKPYGVRSVRQLIIRSDSDRDTGWQQSWFRRMYALGQSGS